MKKTAIALTIAALAAASVAQAAPQPNTFYVGAKAGWASFHDGLNQAKYLEAPEATFGFKRNSVTYGVFGGYQITDNFAVELGYDDFGRAKLRMAEKDQKAKDAAKHTNHGAHLSLKASYPVLDGLDIYARVGAALIRSDYKVYDHSDPPKLPQFKRTHSTQVSPVFAGGLEYAFMPELALRVEYQWVNNVGKVKDVLGERVDYRPDIGSVTAGLSYRFGQSVYVPEVVSKTFTLNSDVTFGFDKADLKPAAQNVLDGIYGEIAQLKSASVAVAGYTDRLGSDAYNLKLSQRRADTVANYLVAKGVAQNAISATGHGEANPVTGNKCDSVKGRKALIACLADDRRVEIAVKGNK
ncbi:porin OmpA [Pasteurella multocida]|uniref:porin OmpA n=1 Tax=Pasteurella multocida TaxID=747 RepID=UPI00099A39C0|nr:porin OmpA [Pasteurella multocida]MCL7760130.1 porin OmpA [Pasteurella multocida]MCL7777755.1 porin OmpA [Pasteurella multocida]OPC89430.1 porin OmpA [Pasteurella multocida subsp. septica]OPC96874.1 porin OmpA [Pasteurella multocida subsp. septica]OPD05265.1 porin OmpA [Pasteurella multocida subsp. septica]